MTVRRGEVFGFLGPNGAGKTTAVKLLLGLVRPTGGEAMVLGRPGGRPGDPAAHRLPARAVPLPELADRPRGAGAALPGCCGWPGRAGADAGQRRAARGGPGRPRRRPGRRRSRKACSSGSGLGVALLGEPGAGGAGRADQRPGPGRAARRAGDHPRAARPRRHGVPEHPPAGGGRAGLRPGDGDRQGPGGGQRHHGRAGRPADQRAAADQRAGRAVVAAAGPLRVLDAGPGVAAGRGHRGRQVPDLVASIVGLGGLVEAVVPQQQSLEERFLELLGAQ